MPRPVAICCSVARSTCIACAVAVGLSLLCAVSAVIIATPALIHLATR